MGKDNVLACIILVAFFSLGTVVGGFAGYGYRNSADAMPAKFAVPNFSFAIAPDGKPISVNSNWSFCVADYDGDGVPDLWIMKQSGTGTNSTEVHILKGPNFQTYILHTGTALHETPNYITQVTAEHP